MEKNQMKTIVCIVTGIMFVQIQYAQISTNRPVSTYSIIAYDPDSGQLGVAVQSHWFSVGSVVPWAEAGVGAVATQSFVKVEYGPDGLELMKKGIPAQNALKKLLSEDSTKDVRQVAMIDIHGNVAVHTGENCIEAAGHRIGKNYSVQANLMEKPTVWPAMAHAFETADGDLAVRMLAALEAAELQGGDIRGMQSAAMLIVTGEPTGIQWKDIVLNLRIEDNSDPLKELRRLIRIHRAYEHANKGDQYLEEDNVEAALIEYESAARYYPENSELPYWTAVTLAGVGKMSKALPIFKEVFAKEERWRKLTPRLRSAKILDVDNDDLKIIMEQ